MRRPLRFLVVASATIALMTVGMAPAEATVTPPVQATYRTSFPPDCNGAPQDGRFFRNSEVEPFVVASPAHSGNLMAVWQQDRWTNGGAQALYGAVSFTGGLTWRPMQAPPFSRCAGGTPDNGGDYERASDPWITVSPDGTAYFMALNISFFTGDNAMTVARSTDGGLTWGPITTLIRDGVDAFNDKNSMTADPHDNNYAYAVWDRLSFAENIGPTYFTRTTDGGETWEPARAIYDPGPGAQTIGNQIAVAGDGTLVNVMATFVEGELFLTVIRSTDRGETWDEPVFITDLRTIGVADPRDGDPVRAPGFVPDIATDPRPGHNDVYLVWQDTRFSGGQADQVTLVHSPDAGLSWSAPTLVSEPGSVQAFTPSVHVADTGQVGVTYYDFTFDTAESLPLQTDHWSTRSNTRGQTWAPRERVTPTSFDTRTAPRAGGYFLGDYVGLTSRGSSFFPFFIQANDGARANRTDGFSARVSGPLPGAAAAREAVVTFTGPGRIDPSDYPLTAH